LIYSNNKYIRKKILLEKSGKVSNNNMETIIDENSAEKSLKTSENTCDASSPSPRPFYPCYSPSYISSYRSKKERRSISDPRASLQAVSSRINLSNNSHRRSTIVCTPISHLEQDIINDNEIILRVPYGKIEDHHWNRRESHHSIAVIKEKSSFPIDEATKEESFYSNSDSDCENCYDKGTTRIKLSLPTVSSGKVSRQRFKSHQIGISQRISADEFTLPTNPPITVTIEPQQFNLNSTIDKKASLHDDQICSPSNVNINSQRLSLDPSIKGTSTVVSYFMDLLKPSDNKLAMKLFGSRKGVLKERLRQQRAGHCIIHPCSNFR
jgi:hypothetical protein